MSDGFLEYKQWLLKSLDGLLEAGKEHDQNLNTKISEVKEMITDLEKEVTKSINSEVVKRKDMESEIKVIKNEVSRRTTLITAISTVLLITVTVLINIFLRN